MLLTFYASIGPSSNPNRVANSAMQPLVERTSVRSSLIGLHTPLPPQRRCATVRLHRLGFPVEEAHAARHGLAAAAAGKKRAPAAPPAAAGRTGAHRAFESSARLPARRGRSWTAWRRLPW